MFWYYEEIERLEKEKKNLKDVPEMAFYGSSSFNHWDDLEVLFKEYKSINLAFGGSTLAACSWFYKRAFKGLNPKSVMIYAGENDLADGRHPEEVVLFFRTLLDQIRKDYGNIPVTFVSVKPSMERWYLDESMRYTNKIISALRKEDDHLYFVDLYDAMLDVSGKPNEDYFKEDKLHLNEKGYKVWFDILSKHIASFTLKE